MIPCEPQKRMKNELKISMLFPITHLYSPTIFETHHMKLGSVIHLKGIAFDTKENLFLNQMKRRWHQTLLTLGESFSIYITLHHRRKTVILDGQFPSPFLKEINQHYYQQFQKEPLYTNDIYLTLLSRGLTTKQTYSMTHWLSAINSKVIQKSREWKREEQKISLEKATYQILSSLSEFNPSLLGSKDQSLGYSELLRFLSLFLNAGKTFRPKFFYPSENLAYYLASHRLFFSRNIEFHHHDHSKTPIAAMISIKKYASQTKPTSLDSLLQLKTEYLSTNSFLIEPKDTVQKIINRQRHRLKNVNDPAKSQINELDAAQEDLASDRITFGHHHNTLMIIEDNNEALERTTAQVIKCYADAGFTAIRETIGQEPAFWAQIPSNTKMIARSALISSENFVDFCPLHNYSRGYYDQNHLGSAVTILKTPGNTPYYFNFHTQGHTTSPSKGHTTIIGGNGAGKTVLMSFLDAQLSRYQGRTFVFDRDRGLEIYLRACDGYYAVLSPHESDTLRFNPLQMPDTAINRKFCREWMAQLIKEENEINLPADLSEAIHQCIDYVFETLSTKDRQLSNAIRILPLHFPRWPHLRRWLKSDGEHPEGEYAYLFDHSQDDFQMQAKMGFDMTHFLDIEPSNVLVAIVMYLFHRLEQSFDGQLVTILLDEGWQYLDNPYWTQKLRKWLPTLRKLNCHLVLATQSPSSVMNSPIRDMILDNTATHLYFTNPQAKREQYQDAFNLTESEYERIRYSDPAKRYFLLKQENESLLCHLDLSSLSDKLPILSANKKTLLLQETLRSRYGNNSKHWLDKFCKSVQK